MTDPSSNTLRLLYAGSLDLLLRRDLLPAFERLTRYRCRGRAGGSRDWAVRIRTGSVEADLFLSADAEVIETELVSSSLVEWHLTFATNALVLAYNDPPSRAEIDRAARGELPLADLLRAGLRLGRPDPDLDPKGYRSLFAAQLLERHFVLPGLAAEALGDPHNPQQIRPAADLIPLLKQGSLDLIFAYRSQAVEESLPFLPLPDEANLGSPAHAQEYAQAAYRCSDGTAYQGALITYAAALLPGGPGATGAAAFLVFLGSEAARDALTQHGFGPTYELTAR
jgi:molybdate/tungstate transport system substrate-binding protein